MKEKYFLTVCTLGEHPNLLNCLEQLLKIKNSAFEDIEVLLVINKNRFPHSFDPGVIVRFEAIKGYSSVRNRAISEISEGGNLIFVDDDELPTLDWFNSLVYMHKRFPSDVISGPVLPALEANPFSYREMYKTEILKKQNGSLLKHTGTGNTLIPWDLIRRNLIYFDPLFNLIGGEDTDLSFKLQKNGIIIRFAKDALLREVQSLQKFDSSYKESRYIKDIANYSLVIRRHGSIAEKFWRFWTLVIRIAVHLPASCFIRSSLVSVKAHSKSLYVLISGNVVGK